MKLIDVRQTPYGKVADVKLETAALSFSIPYVEYALLEKCGMLDNDGMAIESNIRFMTMIHENRIPYPLELGTHTIVSGGEVLELTERHWYNSGDDMPF